MNKKLIGIAVAIVAIVAIAAGLFILKPWAGNDNTPENIPTQDNSEVPIPGASFLLCIVAYPIIW